TSTYWLLIPTSLTSRSTQQLVHQVTSQTRQAHSRFALRNHCSVSTTHSTAPVSRSPSSIQASTVNTNHSQPPARSNSAKTSQGRIALTIRGDTEHTSLQSQRATARRPAALTKESHRLRHSLTCAS